MSFKTTNASLKFTWAAEMFSISNLNQFYGGSHGVTQGELMSLPPHPPHVLDP